MTIDWDAPEIVASLHGPRDHKVPGSVEWAWQSLHLAKRRCERAAKQRDLAQSEFEESISEIQEYRVWERIPPDSPFGSFEALMAAIGVNSPNPVLPAPADLDAAILDQYSSAERHKLMLMLLHSA